MEEKRQLNEKEYLEFIEQWKINNKKLIESGECKKIFLECLPRGGKSISGVTIREELINWDESKGIGMYFVYKDVDGYLYVNQIIKNKLEIIYKNKKYITGKSDFFNNRIGRIIGKNTDEFKIKIEQIFKDGKRDITIIDREYRCKESIDKQGRKSTAKNKWYKYKCNKCGWTEGWMVESDILKNKNGCSCCYGRTVVEGINDIPTTTPWMIKYFQGGYEEAKLYVCRSMKKINPVCPDCGKIKGKMTTIDKIYTNRSIACNCSDKKSYISKYIFDLLEQLILNKQIINFDAEIKFEWCTYYNLFKNKNTFGIYDFVIENKKLIVEADGGWHRKDNNMSKQSKEESEWLDNMKDRLAQENGYKVIRISDEGDIKQNIINSKLNILFDLNNIDWQRCEKYATKNLVKGVCEYWNKCGSMEDMLIKFKSNRQSIISYLKQGAKLGWCNYSSKDEMRKNGFKRGKLGAKQVCVLKDEQSLGIFHSCTEIERQSEELFDVKLFKPLISRACRNHKSYKGYQFKYINDLTEEEYIKYDVENKIKEIQENVKLNLAI